MCLRQRIVVSIVLHGTFIRKIEDVINEYIEIKGPIMDR